MCRIFSVGRIASRGLLASAPILLLSMLALVGFGGRALAQTEAEPTEYEIGLYITSLHDFDTDDDTFGADYWLWSVYPRGEPDPLNSLEYYNSAEVETDFDSAEERGDGVWAQRKVSSIVRHDWDLTEFPFDRQVLEIVLEEGLSDTRSLVYRADEANTGYDEDMKLDGWRIVGFEVRERESDYVTSFGDPAIEGGSSSYARFSVLIEVERSSIGGFFKLIAGVYAAITIMLVSFLMSSDVAPIFSARIIMLVGALFSAVVNMQVSQAALGRPEYLTLVDNIHIFALLFIFGAAVVAVFSRATSEAGKPELARRRDRVFCVTFGVAFALINAALILAAAWN